MGVLLYVFVCGSLPFAGKDMLTLFTNIVNVDYTIPDFLSKGQFQIQCGLRYDQNIVS
jgi:hypothetical protein